MAGEPIRVLVNARQVIDELARSGPLNPAELSDLTGIPRPSVYRLLDGLNAIELTSPAEDGRVSLHLRWLSLADAAQESLTEFANAQAALESLVTETGQTAFLCVPRSQRAVCIRWEQGRAIGVLALRPGRSLPFNAGAAGRVLMAYTDADSFLAQAPFPALTSFTLTEATELDADRQVTLKQGFVLSEQDVTLGIGAIGVPVRAAGGTVAASLSVGGLVEDIRQHESEILRALSERAISLSSVFSH